MAIVGEPGEQTQKSRDLVTAPVCAHARTHTRAHRAACIYQMTSYSRSINVKTLKTKFAIL